MFYWFSQFQNLQGSGGQRRGGHELDHQGNTHTSSKGNSSDDHQGDSEWSDQGLGDDEGLVGSVGEVVVSGRHVVERSGSSDLDQTSVKVRGSDSLGIQNSVEGSAVLSVVISSVVVVLSNSVLDLLVGLALLLSQPGKVLHGREVEQGVHGGLVQRVWQVRSGLVSLERQDVGSVGGLLSISVVLTIWVVVTSGPLDMDIIVALDKQTGWHEIVLGSRVGLDDVSSLSSDVQVEDTSSWSDSGSGSDLEGVGSVLEGSSELVGVDVHLQHPDVGRGGWGVVSVDLLDGGVSVSTDEWSWVVADWSLQLATVSGKKIPVVLVSVSGGDVVSQTQHAGFVDIVRDGPVVSRGVSIKSVSEMVVSVPWSWKALWSWDSVRSDSDPLGVSDGVTGVLVVLDLIGTLPSLLDVLGLSGVVWASEGIRGQDGDILPRSGMPVRIVVSLFWALISVVASSVLGWSGSSVVSVLVLTRGGGSISVVSDLPRDDAVHAVTDCLVGGVQSLVSEAGSAVLIELERLMKTVNVFSGGSLSLVLNTSCSVRRSVLSGLGLGGAISVSHGIFGSTHVLENQVTVVVSHSTGMLGGPLDTEQTSDIKVERRSPTESSGSVVLGIEQSLGVVSVVVSFGQAVVGSSWVLHVCIGIYCCDDREQR